MPLGQRCGLACAVLVPGCFEEPGPFEDMSTSDTGDLSTSATSMATGTGATADAASTDASSTGATEGTSSTESTGTPGDGALRFDGAGHARTVNATSAAALTAAFTVELWLDIEDPQMTIGILADARSNSGDAGGWALYIDPTSRVLSFAYLDSAGTYVGPEGPAIGSLTPGWHHVAVTREKGNGALFIDGAVYSTFVAAEEPATVVTRLTIGGQVEESPDWALRAARIDDLRVSNAALYWPAFEPSPDLGVDASSQLLWRFDEGTGDMAVDDVLGLELALDGVDWADGGPV